MSARMSAQPRFRLEHDISWDAELGSTIGVGDWSSGTQIRARPAVPPWAAYAVHRVHPLAIRPAHPMYWRLTPAVASPCSAARLVQRRHRNDWSPDARPRATTTPIAASWSHTRMVEQPLRLVRRQSPACSARVTRSCRGRSLIQPGQVLPRCPNGCTRAKQGFNRPCNSARFATARSPSMMAPQPPR